MNKREQQKNERRKEILSCCLDLFITKGYEKTGIRDIANKLNISMGLFFNYFNSKESAYEELIEKAMSSQQYIAKICSSNLEPIAVFEQISKMIFDNFGSETVNTKLFILVMQAFGSTSTPKSILKRLYSYDMVTPMLPIIIAGQKKGQIKAGNPVALLNAFWSAVQGITMSMVLFPKIPHPVDSWIVDIIRAH